MRAMRRFLRLFFQVFYHQFAWTYDFVAALVSIGRWNKWIRAVLPFVDGESVLELGHGPGQLQHYLLGNVDLKVIGLDESAQMGHMAKNRLKQAGHPVIQLTRGLAQRLPFRDQAFDTVVSTFPSDYIFNQLTLREVHRVLDEDGRLVVLPAAWIIGKAVLDRAAAWLFRITHQAPRSADEALIDVLRGPLERAGFQTEFQMIGMNSSTLLVIVARKSGGSPAIAPSDGTSDPAHESRPPQERTEDWLNALPTIPARRAGAPYVSLGA
jgi:ubiquinone/menaquinone biosynthesis C-methylase UbiE